jgi:peptidoglycan/LPS O-acetylase OafA/YrhL
MYVKQLRIPPIRGDDEMAAPSKSTPIFYPRLEALRGVAALMVAAFHSWQSTWLDSTGKLRNFLLVSDGQPLTGYFTNLILRVIGNGYGAVVLFFVISGFVLTGSLARGPQRLHRSASRFLIARLFRIYPAVFATVGLFAALFWTSGVFIDTPKAYVPLGLLRNALLINTSIDGVTWSLQLELIAMPAIVLAYFGWRVWGIAVPVVLFFCLAALSFWGPWNRAIGVPNLFGTIHAFMPGVAAFFLAPKLLKGCSPRIATLTLAATITGFFASRPVLGAGSHWAVLSEAIFGAIAVAILAFGNPGGLGRMFDFSLIQFFGRISYSFYLLHPLTLIVMWRMPNALANAIKAGVPVLGVAILLFVASTASVTPVAFAMYKWVERPGVTAGRELVACLFARPAQNNVSTRPTA